MKAIKRYMASAKIGALAIVVAIGVALSGCEKKKTQATEQAQTSEQSEESVSKQKTQWKTCTIERTKIEVAYGENRLQANCKMQVIKDSIAIVSIMPFGAIEMARIEATPEEVVVVDKINARYWKTDLRTINKVLAPRVTWDLIEEIVANELPNTPEMGFRIGEKEISVKIIYGERKVDGDVRAERIDLSRYKESTIEDVIKK